MNHLHSLAKQLLNLEWRLMGQFPSTGANDGGGGRGEERRGGRGGGGPYWVPRTPQPKCNDVGIKVPNENDKNEIKQDKTRQVCRVKVSQVSSD